MSTPFPALPVASVVRAPLDSFLYMSKAVAPFSDAALEDLLVRSRRYNVLRDVTGLLLYDYQPTLKLGQFCQYIEGPPEAVSDVRSRIVTDPRHGAIRVLHKGPAAARLFASWAMGYMPASSLPDVEGFRSLLDVDLPNAGADKRPAALLRVFLEMSSYPKPL